MDKLIEVWVNLIITFQKDISDIPAKIKSAVISKLHDNGFITENDISDVKDAKISEMSIACNSTIVGGFDIKLSDGNTYHFSLEMTDQTMISKLNDKAVAGETFLPWHWDNGSCKIFSADDIKAINAAMENLITFQITYFNSLRDYINSMTEIEDIMDITYGTEIPTDYQSEVLKLLYQQTSTETSE